MNYPAPLDKLPLFVRSGAIIPMYQQMMYNWERPTDTLTLNIYPSKKSEYTMYEDDGLTRDHRKGRLATTKFEVSASTDKHSQMTVTLNAAKGDFNGRQKNRIYLLEIHTREVPSSIWINGKKLKWAKDKGKFNDKTGSWYFDAMDQKGLLHIKTDSLSTDSTTIVGIRMKKLRIKEFVSCFTRQMF